MINNLVTSNLRDWVQAERTLLAISSRTFKLIQEQPLRLLVKKIWALLLTKI